MLPHVPHNVIIRPGLKVRLQQPAKLHAAADLMPEHVPVLRWV